MGKGGKGGGRPGDWTCPQCGNNNFSYRDTCHRCPATRPVSFEHQSEQPGGGGGGYGGAAYGMDPYQMQQMQMQQMQQMAQMAQMQQAMMGGGMGGGQKRARYDGDGFGGGGGYTSSDATTFPAVKVRGLPFEATEFDVTNFFEGVAVIDVVLEVAPDGRKAGTGYVVLGSDEALQGALARNKQSMGRRYLEVFSASKAEYYAAVAAIVTASPGDYQGGGGDNYQQ